MKKALFTFLIFITFQVHAAWDNSVLVGEWENYRYEFDHRYQKLIINKDFSGSFFILTSHTDGELVKFKKSDFKFFEGFAVLDVDDNFKLLLSAWGTTAASDPKRLFGQMFIYTVEDEEIKLINSIPVSYISASDEGFSNFADKVKGAQTNSH